MQPHGGERRQISWLKMQSCPYFLRYLWFLVEGNLRSVGLQQQVTLPAVHAILCERIGMSSSKYGGKLNEWISNAAILLSTLYL